MTAPIQAVAFDCYGTLIDFGDDAFARAYGQICAEQGIDIEGKQFFEKWMEVWRRLAISGQAADTGSVGVAAAGAAALNQPGPLSQADEVPPHPQHHTPSAGRDRRLNGPLPPFRPYSEEWPEHFEICFEELGVRGDGRHAYERLVEMLGEARAFPEAQEVVAAISRRFPVALLSNADDNFLHSVLRRNALSFPVIVSSESARAYKPHVAIFQDLSARVGLPAEAILYVGDSRLADIAGAKNAGMKAAWVNRKDARPLEAAGAAAEAGDSGSGRRPARTEVPDPDFELKSLADLLDILRI